jgi:hypothetical protein
LELVGLAVLAYKDFKAGGGIIFSPPANNKLLAFSDHAKGSSLLRRLGAKEMDFSGLTF